MPPSELDPIHSMILYSTSRVSLKTSFDAKQPKLEAKLVSALYGTKCLFWLFPF